MREYHYELGIPSSTARRAATAWLGLGLVSLVAAGIFSILLVVARTPVVQDLIPLVDVFRIALVVHVTMSVLIWLLAVSAATWSLSSSTDTPHWDRFSFILAAAGTAVLITSPFAGADNPQMSNYLSVLQHPLFFAGLILFVAGICSHLVRSFVTRSRIAAHLSGEKSLQAGITIAFMGLTYYLFATSRIRPFTCAPGVLATLFVRRRAIPAHSWPRLERRLRRTTQDGRNRARPGRTWSDHRHRADGTRRVNLRDRRIAVSRCRLEIHS